MAKQIHIRLEDNVFEALSKYSKELGLSVQDCVSGSIIHTLSKKNRTSASEAPFTFIDLFAGIGGMRIAFEETGGKCVYSNEWNKYSQQT